MEVEFRSVHFTADSKLINFIESRLKKLELFNDTIVSSEVFLRLENTADLSNKIAEIKLNTPGLDLFAKKQAKSFEEAADEAVEALRRQLIKRKGKLARA